MNDRNWDRRLHIRTIGREDESSANYSPYEATPYSVLERLSDSGHIRRRDHLLDFGCGKGRVAFFMASVVGCRVTGIDHSKKLIDIAIENRKASRLGDRVRLFCARAEQYEIGDENVLFFFNPFSEKIFDSVLRRLKGEARVICYYPSPAYIDCLDRNPAMGCVDAIDCGNLFNGRDVREQILVYRHRGITTD